MSEIVVLVGLPGSGKTTYMKKHFIDTHLRINLDMLKHNRTKETKLLSNAVGMGIPCVIDNTNVTRESRTWYITLAKAHNIPCRCVYVNKDAKTCISQNKLRLNFVPDIAIYTMNKKFEAPSMDEGFSEILVVGEEDAPFKGKKRILCLDFDGVIHGYQSGWKGADKIPDPPVPGAFEFLAEALNHFDVHIYSSRSGHNGGIEAMKEWFDKNGFNSSQLLFPTHKPAATVGIDDRQLTFDGTWPSMDKLKKFKPWNKQKL